MRYSKTAYVLLGLLSVEPDKSGYGLRKAIEGSVGHFWGESYGQIYPTLKRLATEGLIEASRSATTMKRGRQEYSLTDAGRTCLRDWLALPFHNDPPRNEFLLKLFFGREAAPGVSVGHIRDLQERNQRMLALLLGIEKDAQSHGGGGPHERYWMLTLSLGIALTRTALEWGEGALATLGGADAVPDRLGDGGGIPPAAA
ncbi:MAG TPA: PadR family transcriptional regulator [Acidobacteriaceae bacterium]|jgi:DNA-binding PadR family transcriptional regulator|nr:PadR family transcriptional regulator [Acidobacteriaceae bacterium]